MKPIKPLILLKSFKYMFFLYLFNTVTVVYALELTTIQTDYLLITRTADIMQVLNLLLNFLMLLREQYKQKY